MTDRMFGNNDDIYVICEVMLRDDGSIQVQRIGSVSMARLAYNTVRDLNRNAVAYGVSKFYQIEHRPGIDTYTDF